MIEPSSLKTHLENLIPENWHLYRLAYQPRSDAWEYQGWHVWLQHDWGARLIRRWHETDPDAALAAAIEKALTYPEPERLSLDIELEL